MLSARSGEQNITADGEITWQKDLIGLSPVGVAELDDQYLIAGLGYGTAFITPDGKAPRIDYGDASICMFYSLDATKKGKVVLGGCENNNGGKGLSGKISVYEDTAATSSPLSAGIILASLLGACAAVICRRK